MNENLFSYGTLQKETVQLKLFGRLLNSSKDILRGYKLSSIEIKDELFLSKGEQKTQFTLIPSGKQKDQIKGTVLEISKEELLLADNYEPNNYKRFEVVLASGKKAWMYAASYE